MASVATQPEVGEAAMATRWPIGNDSAAVVVPPMVAAPSAQRPGMKFRRALGRRDLLSLAGMAGLVVLLHTVGVGLLIAWVVPEHLPIGGGHPVFTVGVGMLAYTFGVRHGFDADHIAAVDNTIRKLLADRAAASHERAGDQPRRRPLSVGFWFSLGHSTVVFLLAVLLAAGVKHLVGAASNDASVLHTVTGIIGPAVSGLFLWILGGLNLITLLGILRVFRQMRDGRCDDTELQRQLNNRGLMNRFLGGLARAVRKPWHIYPIGLLFGLGFDTATEVGLLVLAGGAAAMSPPFYAVLVLPVLFAAGMCLVDTADGVLMNAAYGWSFARPVRKVFYNLSITTISVVAALVIGTIELVGVLTDQAAITSGPFAWVSNINLDYAGYGIVGLFLAGWLIALGMWRYGHIEQRWSATAITPAATPVAPGQPGKSSVPQRHGRV
jgi:high-affinity nickel-transport protein